MGETGEHPMVDVDERWLRPGPSTD